MISLPQRLRHALLLRYNLMPLLNEAADVVERLEREVNGLREERDANTIATKLYRSQAGSKA